MPPRSQTPHESTNGGTRITNAQIFDEVRKVGDRAARVEQKFEDVVLPWLERHDRRMDKLTVKDEEQGRAINGLNIKFYGIIAGAVLGGAGIFAKLAGVL